jgi:hypothetical protein
MKGVVAVLLLLTLCIGCNSVSPSSQQTPTPQTPFQGSWEFVAVSTVNPPPASSVRLVEVSLTQTGNQVNSTQVAAAYYDSTWTPQVQPCGLDGCVTSITGTANGSSLSFSGTLINCGGTAPCSFQAQGTLNGSTITGTWTASGISAGPDAGTFTATLVTPKLSGAYTGTLQVCTVPVPNGCSALGSDNASVVFNQGNSGSINLTATLSGTDNGAFPLSGSLVGNVMLVSGTISGQSVSLLGYYDQTGQYTGAKNSIEVFDLAAGSMSMGLLQGN